MPRSISTGGRAPLIAPSEPSPESESHHVSPDDLTAEICACVSRLAKTLKPEYAEALEAIDVKGVPVKAFAEHLTASNAGVRAFRAREALRKRVIESCGTCAEHGCLDCTCRTAGTSRGRDADAWHCNGRGPAALSWQTKR